MSDAPATEGTPQRSTFVLTALAALVPVLAALIVFWPTIGYSFVNYDDGTNIFANPYIVPVEKQNLLYFWTHSYYDLYMPLTFSVWALLARIAPLPQGLFIPGGGTANLNPAVYHTASVLLHAVNSLLAFALLRRLGFGRVGCAAGALLFAIHPLQAESVGWVTGMNNLTSGLFGLLALIFYCPKPGAEDVSTRPTRSDALATLFYVLALLAKPTATAIPLAAAVLEIGIFRRPRSRWLPILGSWAVLAVGLAILTRFTSSYSSGRVWSPLWGRPVIVGDALAFYLGKLLWPRDMTIDYHRTIPFVLYRWQSYALCVVPLGLALLLWKAGPQAKWLRVAAALFVALMLPMLGFVAFYSQEFTTVSNRYLYLALLGPGLLMAWLLSRPWPKPAQQYAASGIAAILLVAAGVRTVLHLPVWTDTFTVSENLARISPSDTAAHSNLGISFALRGDLPRALEQFRIAAAQKPNEAEVQYHLGVTLADMGDLAGSIPPLQAAIKIDPKQDEAWFRLGIALAKTGRMAEAEAALRQRLRLRPEDGQSHYILGVLLGNQKRFSDAATELQEAARLLPTFAEAPSALGTVLQRMGRREESQAAFREALRRNPADAKAQAALGGTPSPPK